MDTKVCMSFAERYECEYDGSKIWGKVKNIPVLIKEKDCTLMLNMGMGYPSRNTRRALEELLTVRSYLDRYDVSYARVTDQMVQVDFPIQENVLGMMEAMLLQTIGFMEPYELTYHECYEEMERREPLRAEDQQVYIPDEGEVYAEEYIKAYLKAAAEEPDFEEKKLYYAYKLGYPNSPELKRWEPNYRKGLRGALLFASLMSVLWIALGVKEWFNLWVGYPIGMAAAYGYDRMRGKEGKARVPIIMAAGVFVCLVAMVLTQLLLVGWVIYRGYIPGKLTDVPYYIYCLYTQSDIYRQNMFYNLLSAIVFPAAAGFNTAVK